MHFREQGDKGKIKEDMRLVPQKIEDNRTRRQEEIGEFAAR